MQSLREVRGKAVQIQTDPDQPGTPNYANLETPFGLQPGDGEKMFAELDSLCNSLGMPDTNPSGQIDRSAVWASLEQFIDQIG